MRMLLATRTRAVVVPCLAIFFLSQTCFAQFWEKKPYQQWSKDETQKMLADSPWSREVVLANVAASQVNRVVRERIPTGGNEQLGAKVTYQIQIRSARPVRQAVVRLAQLSPKYQQMAAEQKQRVDRNAEDFINAKSDEIVFWVNYTCDVDTFAPDMRNYWQSQAVASLKNTVWLQVPGMPKIEMSYFAPGPGQSFELRFPRPSQVGADGSLVLEFRHPDGVAGQKGQRVLAEFKLKKLTIAGETAY